MKKDVETAEGDIRRVCRDPQRDPPQNPSARVEKTVSCEVEVGWLKIGYNLAETTHHDRILGCIGSV